MSTQKLIRLTGKLCRYAPLLAMGADTPKDEDAFYGALAQVLALPPAQEVWVMDSVRDTLNAMSAEDTLLWLEDTVEAKSSMEVWEDLGGQKHECLLFAVPFVTPASETLQPWASEGRFSALLDAMQSTQLFVPGARVGLVNRVLGAADLLSRTAGELARLRAELCEQLLDEKQTQLRLPLSWASGPPTGQCGCTGVQLHYVIGVVACDAAEEPFEKISEAAMEGIPLRFKAGPPPGYTEDGRVWDTTIAAHLCDAFAGTHVLAVSLPEAIYDAVRTGGQVARGVSFSEALRQSGQALSRPWANIVPLLEPDGPYGYHVDVETADRDQPSARLFWPILQDETPGMALDALSAIVLSRGVDIGPELPGTPAYAGYSAHVH